MSEIINHRFVEGEQFALCAHCGLPIADFIHTPIFPEELPKIRAYLAERARRAHDSEDKPAAG